MPVIKEQLIQQLLEQVTHFSQQCEKERISLERPLNIKSDMLYFTDNELSLAEYLQELRTSIEQLAQLDDLELLHFKTEQIYTQFRLLYDAVENQRFSYQQPRRSQKHRYFTRPVKNHSQNKNNHPAHRLPEKQRLQAYYRAENVLNQEIDTLKQLISNEQELSQKQLYLQELEIFFQRRQNCLDAITQLEEKLQQENAV